MLLAFVLAVYGALSLVTRSLAASTSNSSILNFDDIPTTQGLGPTPPSYHHLAFSHYSVLRPQDPNLKGIISPNDLNCAVSSPNALIGSRVSSSNHDRKRSTPEGAYFSVANATHMVDAGLQPYFTLLSFNLKPMDAPPPGTEIIVKGYSRARNDSDPFEWHVDFPVGYHLPLFVKMQQYSGDYWDQLYRVEIMADFGEQRLDWEFCIDDLEIQFFQSNSSSELAGSQRHLQVVLGDD